MKHLKVCKLPTLHYRQVRGDTIEMKTILTGKYDADVTSKVTSLRFFFLFSSSSNTVQGSVSVKRYRTGIMFNGSTTRCNVLKLE